MKITFAMIVFNGDYVLKQLLESIYPFAHKIIIVDGVVKYWAERGFSGSIDKTIDIIKSFPDKEHKIILHEKVVRYEKTELCQVYMNDVPDDTDYLWCIDSDEIFKSEDIEKTIKLLQDKQPHSLSFTSRTFFGGFDRYLTGFERNVGFKRVLKFEKGCCYVEHRPPRLSTENVSEPIHISASETLDKGIEMYHYSYVFACQVKEKIQYYKEAVSFQNAIDDYFTILWMRWVTGNDEEKLLIEQKYNGVHEFIPSIRGECFTAKFNDTTHPKFILRDMKELKMKFYIQLSNHGNRE